MGEIVNIPQSVNLGGKENTAVLPSDWLIPNAAALPYNPFLEYPPKVDGTTVLHEAGMPWLTSEDIQRQIGFVPDAVFCYTGAIKQPWLDREGGLHAPLEGDREIDQEGAPEPSGDIKRSQNLRRNYPYGAASFTIGEDPYRKDIQGTGGKVNVIATKHICEVIPQDVPVYTAATFSNDIERRMAAEQGMPTAAAIYEHELKRFGVENPIIKLDDEDITNSLEMVMATIRAVHANPSIKNAVAVTLRYHIPRADAFLEVCGMGKNKEIQDWIFENWKARTGKDLLTDEYRQMVKELHERGTVIEMIGAEDIMDQVDLNKIAAGAQPRYGSVLRLIYPPKLSESQIMSMSPEQQQDWIDRVNNLKVRLETEARGVSQIKNKTYWSQQ